MTTNLEHNVSTSCEMELLHEVDRELDEDSSIRRREALKREADEAKAKGQVGGLAKVMRYAGAALLITAAAIFLVQGWGEMDHLSRYFSFLGFTAAMCVAGFFCGIRIKEDKGARTFMALSALVVPAHFAQLGALIHSASSYRIPGVQYPGFLTWVAPSMELALLTTAIGVVALAPIALISFLSLARKQAWTISSVYLLSCSALLIPVRDPDLLAVAVIALTVLAGFFDLSVFARDPSMRTPEGRMVRGMLMIPLVTIIVRTLQLYEPTQFFAAVFFAVLGAVSYLYIPSVSEEKEVKGFFESTAAAPVTVSWMLIANLLFGLEYSVLVTGLPLAAIFGLMALGASGRGRFLQSVSMLTALGSAFVELSRFNSTSAVVVALTVSVLVMIAGYAHGSRFFLLSAAAVFGFGLIRQVAEAITIYSISPWLSLAILGIVTVIAGSYVERNYSGLRSAMLSVKGKFGCLER